MPIPRKFEKQNKRESEREAKESNRNTDGDRKEPKVGRVN